MTVLRTDRLRLRPLRASDLESLHALFADPQVMRYGTGPPHRHLAQTEAWLADRLNLSPARGEDFAIELQGEVIGKAGFPAFPEIGFMLSRRHWGQGLAREAVAAVVAHGLDTLGLRAIVADVDPRNAASLKLLASLGFRVTGLRRRTWCIEGAWSDSVDLALDAPR